MNLLEATFDEFNSYPAINFWAQSHIDPTIVTFNGYECLYPLIPNIITIDQPHNLHQLPTEERQKLITDYMQNELKMEYQSAALLYENCVGLEEGKHIYKYLFSKFAQYIIENGKPLFIAPQADLDYVAQLYSTINKPVAVVNGRNLYKHEHLNKTLHPEITTLINKGYFVINCTINKPSFQLDPNTYLELTMDELWSYNRQVAYMSLSDITLMVAGNAGVTTHIMTDSNVIIYGEGGWVDNDKFGYEGESIYSARKKYLSDKITMKASNVDELINVIDNL